MKKFKLLCISAMLFASFANAQNVSQMKEKIAKSFPNLNVEEVTYVKELNLYELRMKDIPTFSYTNENNDFFLINGELIDVKNKVNYTKDREFNGVKKFLASLRTDKAIVVKYGKGTRKMAVFSDPDCPFCKAMDQEIHTKLTNMDLTVYYYMNPLNIPGHEQAPLKAAKIWCDKDRSKAWVNWMLNGVLPTNDGSCKNPVADTKKFSAEAGFNGTPTIIFDNGYTARQQLSAEQIVQTFNAKKP